MVDSPNPGRLGESLLFVSVKGGQVWQPAVAPGFTVHNGTVCAYLQARPSPEDGDSSLGPPWGRSRSRGHERQGEAGRSTDLGQVLSAIYASIHQH